MCCLRLDISFGFAAYRQLRCCGVVWCIVVWCGVVWCDVMWCGVVWCSVVWCDVVWCDVVWCDVWCLVWCVVWCGVVWCDVVWRGVTWSTWTLRISHTIQVTTSAVASQSVTIIIFISSNSVSAQTMDILFTALRIRILCHGRRNIARLYLDPRLSLFVSIKEGEFRNHGINPYSPVVTICTKR